MASLFVGILHAQTNVDRLVRSLDSLSTVSFDHWRVSADLKTAGALQDQPTKAGFDDGRWDTLRIGQRIYPDSCWIRREIVLPREVLGKPISGRVRFLVSVDDYGYMWINGESRGHFPWNGEFLLTENAKPGETFLVAIKAINTGGPLRLLRAEIQTDELRPIRELLSDFSLSLRVGQKLLSFDTYQTNASQRVDPGIDKSELNKEEKIRLNNLLQNLATQIDLDALRRGSLDAFMTSVEGVRKNVKPIAEYARQFTLYFASNAHIDAAWLWREKETIEVCKNTFSSVLNMMEARPDFTYTQSSAVYYDWMEKLYPELFSRIKQRVREGRWELVGGMWIEPDCNLLSGESWARQLLYGKRYFRQKLGQDVRIGWNPDSFGYNWNMPQFYLKAGIDAFITQKIGWSERNVFPHRVFWWEGPDGSRLLTYFPFDYVNQIDDPYRLVDWQRQFEANTGFKNMLVLFGVGDHGGGPSLEMMTRIDNLKRLDIYPNVEFGNVSQYLTWLKTHDLTRLPIWNDELYLEYHQGTFTTQAKTKESNRQSEVLLTNAEKFSLFSTRVGGRYPSSELADAWSHVMFNQFHDILPGSSIREVYVDAMERYAEAATIGNYVLSNSLRQIARSINTSSMRKGTPVVVFNPLAWERSDIARIELPPADTAAYAVFDAKGKEVSSQTVRKDRYLRELLFAAENVPSLGYRAYEVRKQSPSTLMESLTITGASLENAFFRVRIDTLSGWISSILDKRNFREILDGNGNELELLADYPRAWDAWNIGLTGEKYPSRFTGVEIVEQGPLRVVLRLNREYLKPGTKKEYPTEYFPTSFFSQEIILAAGIPRIEFRTLVDWWEEKTFLKVSFPVAVRDTVATYEIPYGSIRRSTQLRTSWEQAKVEVPALRWADLSGDGYGVSILNRAKYGHDIKGSTIRLSLLRSPKWPDPTADRGKHIIEYALFPHRGDWRAAMTVRHAYEYNAPLLTVWTDAHSGSLPLSHSFIQISPSNLVLSNVKKAEDSDAWIVQWYESEGRDAEAILTLPRGVQRVVLSNFLEEDGAPVACTDNGIRLATPKNGAVTIKIYY